VPLLMKNVIHSRIAKAIATAINNIGESVFIIYNYTIKLSPYHYMFNQYCSKNFRSKTYRICCHILLLFHSVGSICLASLRSWIKISSPIDLPASIIHICGTDYRPIAIDNNGLAVNKSRLIFIYLQRP
jgi:hypothetical protein